MTVPVMRLLESRVPLTLLLDLIDPERLPSKAILRREAAERRRVRPERQAG